MNATIAAARRQELCAHGLAMIDAEAVGYAKPEGVKDMTKCPSGTTPKRARATVITPALLH